MRSGSSASCSWAALRRLLLARRRRRAAPTMMQPTSGAKHTPAVEAKCRRTQFSLSLVTGSSKVLFMSPRAGRRYPSALAVLLLALARRSEGATLADSFDDWSSTGTQGERNWFSGYYNLTQDAGGTYQAADFIPFKNSVGPAGGAVSPAGNNWTGTQWDMTTAASGPWTELGREDTHPNGTNSAPNEEHWTIRRWVSNRSGQLAVKWHIRKTNIGCGNGVSGRLFINGTQVDSAVIDGGDGVGVTKTHVANLAVGDRVDLALTPVGIDGNGNDGCDGSASRLTVEEVSDGDGDGVPDFSDNCPAAANANQADQDGDAVGDVCDNCPSVLN